MPVMLRPGQEWNMQVHLDFAWMFGGHECLARNTFWISFRILFLTLAVSPRSLYTYIYGIY